MIWTTIDENGRVHVHQIGGQGKERVKMAYNEEIWDAERRGKMQGIREWQTAFSILEQSASTVKTHYSVKDEMIEEIGKRIDAALREQQDAIAQGLERWAKETKAVVGADWIRSCAKYVRAFEPGKEDREDG